MRLPAEPAVPEPVYKQPLELIAAPRKLSRIAIGAAAVIMIAFIAVGVLLKRSEAGVAFTTADQLGIAGIGVVLAAGALLFTVPRVWANAERVRVRNVFTVKNVPWGVVSDISVTAGAQWGILNLHDDDQVPMLGIQVSDGQRAVDSMRRLRGFHEQYIASLPPKKGRK